MTTWSNITFFRGYDLPVVKTRIFANSLKNMVPIVTNSQTGSLIKNRTRNWRELSKRNSSKWKESNN